MKKIIVCLFIVTVLVLVNKEEIKVLIPEDAIRFRIIANSNKIEDQTQKLEIKKVLHDVRLEQLAKEQKYGILDLGVELANGKFNEFHYKRRNQN